MFRVRVFFRNGHGFVGKKYRKVYIRQVPQVGDKMEVGATLRKVSGLCFCTPQMPDGTVAKVIVNK